ncbi:tetratricopeptide repeat protein [Aestuariivivens sediminicola]|uniref:tetratricopeptide repeat protein n=1 Tax=Aestuariivivens sediminicola TaxID=2913560 RepID=UPI001F56A269|nr:tetratricopeptide repeat protein [Aestuariivivens sediminicola]
MKKIILFFCFISLSFSAFSQDLNWAQNFFLGNLNCDKGQHKEALTYYNKAIELLGNDLNQFELLEIYFERANCKVHLKDSYGALKDYNKIIPYYEKILPNGLSIQGAYYTRGLIKIDLNDQFGGCKDLSISGEKGFMDAYDAIQKYCN